MARTKFMIKTCNECIAFVEMAPGSGECRMDPPTVINTYCSTYPIMSVNSPACFQGVPMFIAKQRKPVRKPVAKPAAKRKVSKTS